MMSTLLDTKAQPAATATGRPARHVSPLAVILIAGLVLRVALWLWWRDVPVRIVDAQDYNRLAVRLVETGSYITESGQLSSLRPPLYPAMIAGIYSVFGVENFAAVRAVDALLGLATAVLTWQLGAIAFSPRVGVWGAAFVCFYPSFLGFANLLLSETLFTFLVTAVTLASVAAVQRQSLWLLALAGVLLALGALTRSVLWLMTPVLTVYLLAVWGERESGALSRNGLKGAAHKRFLTPFLARRLLAAALPVVAFAVVVAPWAWRNTRVQKTFTLIDVMGGRNAMMGNYEHTPLERSWATIDIARGEKAWYAVLRRRHPESPGLTQGQRDKLAMSYAKKYVLAHPWQTMQRDVVKFFNFWQLERTLVAGAVGGLFEPLPKALIVGAALLICGSYAAAMFAGIFGAVFVPPEDRRTCVLLRLMIAVPCAAHSLVFAHSRYHLPLMPIILLFAASAALSAPVIWSQRRSLRFVLAAAACTVLTLAWLREVVFVDFAKGSSLVG